MRAAHAATGRACCVHVLVQANKSRAGAGCPCAGTKRCSFRLRRKCQSGANASRARVQGCRENSGESDCQLANGGGGRAAVAENTRDKCTAGTLALLAPWHRGPLSRLVPPTLPGLARTMPWVRRRRRRDEQMRARLYDGVRSSRGHAAKRDYRDVRSRRFAARREFPKPYRRIARPISVPIPLPHADRERTKPTWMNDSPWM